MNGGARPAAAPDFMEPVVAVLLRRFDLQLRQLDPEIEMEGGVLRRIYRLGCDELVTISMHRDLFRLSTGAEPKWEARIRSPEEALAGLARVFDHYWCLIARGERNAC